MILFPFSFSFANNRSEKITVSNNLLKEISIITKEIICRETKSQIVAKVTPVDDIPFLLLVVLMTVFFNGFGDGLYQWF